MEFVFFFSTIVPPENIHTHGNQTVNQHDSIKLNCTADGNPVPNITWTRLSDSSFVAIPLRVTAKQDEGVYRCTADNGVGNAATSEVFITVQSKCIRIGDKYRLETIPTC